MPIGELARTCCASRDTLRFYEDRGLIRTRRRANRDYPTETVQLALLVESRIDALVELRQALRQRLQDRCPLTLKGAPA
ncbi:MerR family DNA-binding transcriptional regulator [Pseudomonas japonica]|uniref:MerR family DNA-binding transcriptional regulator n=1 Tax=Pseudomonas japonica TaxID=256466 RepID=UPI00380229CC